ncbi:MAG: YybH family protein [Caulobacterales bacterium]|jgi:ketosteroid isomerase-like protein
MTQVLRPALVAGALGLAALAGCQKSATTAAATPAAAVDTASIERTLRDNETQWNADYKAKDLARIAAHYAPDATLMDPDTPLLSGTDALNNGLKDFISDPALSLEFKADKVEVAASGDLAYTRGTFRLTTTDPRTRTPVTQTGSYVTVYKKQADGSWKAEDDIATNTPRPSAIAKAD